MTEIGDGTFRSAWIREVYRSPRISDTVRVTLRALAEDMDDAGRVQVPRDVMARRLSRTERRISERYQEAVAQGFLERVSRGSRGGAAVFQARLPQRAATPERVTGHSALSGPERVTPRSTLSDEKGDASQHPFRPRKGDGPQHPNIKKEDTRGAPFPPERVLRGVALSGPPYIEEEEKGEVIDASHRFIKTTDSPPPAGSTLPPLADPGATVNQRAQALASRYYEAVGKLVEFMGVFKIVKAAIESERGHTDTDIDDALLRMAAEGRVLTKTTMRVALEGTGPTAGDRRRQDTHAMFADAMAAAEALENGAYPRGGGE